MPEPFSVLLDQNIPRAIAAWLRQVRPSWIIRHTAEVGLAGKSDEIIFAWAQQQQAFIITFDEDFADRRSFPIGTHCGMARLRVWPTRNGGQVLRSRMARQARMKGMNLLEVAQAR